MLKKYTLLFVGALIVVGRGPAIAQAEQAHIIISPNSEIQTFLHQFSSLKLPDHSALFSEDERQMLADAKTETEVTAVLREKFVDLQNRAGGIGPFIGQLLYFKVRATDVPEAMLPVAILSYMNYSPIDITPALLPYLESEEKDVAKEAAELLSGFDYNHEQKTYDFRRYEQVLDDTNGKWPDGLIRYMYNRDPETAMSVMERVVGIMSPQTKSSDEFKGDQKTTLLSLSNHSEWWVQLYVVEIMMKNPQLYDPAILKNLETSDSPLVKEALEEMTFGNPR